MPSANKPVVTRFAPSPTGHLHLGHLYAAHIAHDYAKDHDGKFLLRFEDIDITRVRPNFYDEIEEDLHWLSLEWTGKPLRQTDRSSAYEDALEKLKSLDVVYPCFCTRKDIERELQSITRAPHGPEGPLYPGTCLKLSPAQISTRLSNGESPAWRFNASKASQLCGPLSFTDQIFGKTTVDPDLLGDTILARKDIGTSYHIAVVVDDAYQEISHVTRGKDLLASTHLHRMLQTLLKLPTPSYLHHDLVADTEGNRLAKRHQSLSIRSLREEGYSPEQIWDMLKKAPKI